MLYFRFKAKIQDIEGCVLRRSAQGASLNANAKVSVFCGSLGFVYSTFTRYELSVRNEAFGIQHTDDEVGVWLAVQHSRHLAIACVANTLANTRPRSVS